MSSKPIKDLIKGDVRLTSGHRLCAGCPEAVIARQVLMATDKPVIASSATGCFEVSTTIFPYTAWNIPWVHTAFGNGAATGAGTEAAYQALRRKGKIDEEMRFVTFGGDGATYDIGFQALSGMVERGHQLMYVCFNNEAYMNTGIQRSGATGFGASTTTSPAGKEVPGKTEHPKDLTMIMAAHDIPYTAQVSPYYWRDLIAKAEKGFECGGPAFLNAISPCPRGWRFNSEDGMILSKLAVETCVWPLYEYENGKYSLTSESKRIAEGKSEKKPVTEWFKAQGRYKHMLAEGNEALVAKVQAEIDRKWERLIALTKL